MKYNWQLADWPNFQYSLDGVGEALLRFSELMGQVSGVLKAIPAGIETEAVIDTMVAEAMKTSEIEGEYLSRQDVVSSIKNNLGLNKTVEHIRDKNAKGAGELMIEVRKTYSDRLEEETILQWHKILMNANAFITPGTWRTHAEPMQVISGAAGKEKVHFEAPPSSAIPEEMKRFVQWFNDTAPAGKNEMKIAPVRAAVTHLYFETLHPFEDGNGRIGRALAEKALSQTLGRPVLLSLSRAIEADKKLYYGALEKAQRSNEITPWIKYFVEMVLTAQKQSEEFVDFILKKSKFFDRVKDEVNERQLKVINRMLDAGPDGFEGGMNAGKYMSIAKTSKATATRDLQHLTELGLVKPEGGGRSTRYVLVMDAVDNIV